MLCFFDAYYRVEDGEMACRYFKKAKLIYNFFNNQATDLKFIYLKGPPCRNCKKDKIIGGGGLK